MLNQNILPKKYWKSLIFILLGVLFVRALDMLPVMIVGKTIDSLHKIDHTFYLLIGSLITLILLKLLIYPWQTKNLYRLVLEANRDISVNWTQAILHKEYHFFQIGNCMVLTLTGFPAIK